MENRVLVLETIKVLRTVYNTASHKHRGLGLNLGVDSGGRIGAGGGGLKRRVQEILFFLALVAQR